MKNYRSASRIFRFFGVIFLGSLLIPFTAEARPEYATRTKMDCTACHVTPWGGGPRTLFGKSFGTRGLGNPKTNASDAYYASMRTIAYYPLPSNPSQNANGTASMEAAVAGNAQVLQNEDGSELRAVGDLDAATLLGGANLREGYFRWKTHGDENHLVNYVLFGRFYQPFGLLTDEHRTYTRMQTNMTLNDFSYGGAISGKIMPSLSYDLTLVNDFGSGGRFTTGDFTWGQVFNLRWNPQGLPFLLGFSENYEHFLYQPQPYAFSLYGVVSLDRITSNKVNGSIDLEAVTAKNWNSISTLAYAGPTFFAPAGSPFATAVAASQSLGLMGMFELDLSNRWTLKYKFDYLAMDVNFEGDAFQRHGFGFEYHFNSNMYVDARYEKAVVGAAALTGSAVYAAQDDAIAMLRLWI